MLFVLFLTPIAWARTAQRRALDIYDEIASPAPAVDLRPQEAHAQPSSQVGVKTAHASANGGTRRQRRRRAK